MVVLLMLLLQVARARLCAAGNFQFRSRYGRHLGGAKLVFVAGAAIGGAFDIAEALRDPSHLALLPLAICAQP